MIPEIKSSMAMQEETEESSYLRPDEERGDGEGRREQNEGDRDGYDPDNPRAKLTKLGQGQRRYDDPTFARMRRRSSPAKPRPNTPPAVRVRMMMDEDLSAASSG